MQIKMCVHSSLLGLFVYRWQAAPLHRFAAGSREERATLLRTTRVGGCFNHHRGGSCTK